MAINALNTGTPANDSQIPFFDTTNGQDRKASLAEVAAVLLASQVAAEITQYAAPNATGFGVQIVPGVDGGSVYLLLTPAAGYAAGTITLPAVALCQDGQQVRVSCTQAVTTLTVAGNGATVNGAPAALTANSFLTLRFNGVLSSWFRVA